MADRYVGEPNDGRTIPGDLTDTVAQMQSFSWFVPPTAYSCKLNATMVDPAAQYASISMAHKRGWPASQIRSCGEFVSPRQGAGAGRFERQGPNGFIGGPMTSTDGNVVSFATQSVVRQLKCANEDLPILVWHVGNKCQSEVTSGLDRILDGLEQLTADGFCAHAQCFLELFQPVEGKTTTVF